MRLVLRRLMHRCDADTGYATCPISATCWQKIERADGAYINSILNRFINKNHKANRIMAKMLSVIATLFVVSVPPNFLWEVAQMPLYVDGGKLLEFAMHCIIPSLGDGLIVLIIFSVGWAALRRSDWFDQPGLAGYALMLFTGFVIAIAIEWIAVYFIDRWSYTASMPLLPGLKVGLSPVLQMLVLPPAIFKVTAWWLGRRQWG